MYRYVSDHERQEAERGVSMHDTHYPHCTTRQNKDKRQTENEGFERRKGGRGEE